jgi:putative membrane protein
MFATMQLQQRYEGRDITVRRLRRQQIVGAFLLLISACLMLMKWFHLGPLRGDEWKLTLAIAALLQLYTAFRLPAALRKSEEQ